MNSVFIRHNMGSTPSIRQELWDSRLIAVHYNNNTGIRPEDYPDDPEQPQNPRARKALRRLWRYCDEGAIVAAAYPDIRDRLLLGQIVPGSQVVSRWFGEATNPRVYCYKTVALTNNREIAYRDYPVLAAIQPQQGTITGWPSAQKVLQAIINHQPLPEEITSLSPGQLEVLCYEYLRYTGQITTLLLPIGRSLIDVDIFALDSVGADVIAQATYSDNEKVIKQKLERLKAFAPTQSRLFFFGRAEKQIHDPKVTFIAAETVFSVLREAHPELIRRMVRGRGTE